MTITWGVATVKVLIIAPPKNKLQLPTGASIRTEIKLMVPSGASIRVAPIN